MLRLGVTKISMGKVRHRYFNLKVIINRLTIPTLLVSLRKWVDFKAI
jgi:hypothetical protein